ncbi:MAG: hypothetical protein B6D61_10080, partial [Bacteroidetes bacterium 4484_249]
NRMYALVVNQINYYRERVLSLQKSYGLNRPVDYIRQYAMQVDELNINLQRQIKLLLQRKREQANQLALRLKGLNHKSILARGYSISFIDNKAVKSIRSVKSGQELVTELFDGKIYSAVDRVKKEEDNE